MSEDYDDGAVRKKFIRRFLLMILIPLFGALYVAFAGEFSVTGFGAIPTVAAIAVGVVTIIRSYIEPDDDVKPLSLSDAIPLMYLVALSSSKLALSLGVPEWVSMIPIYVYWLTVIWIVYRTVVFLFGGDDGGDDGDDDDPEPEPVEPPKERLSA